MNFMVFPYLLVLLICNVTAFNNLAFNRDVIGKYVTTHSTTFVTRNLTDGEITTCASLKGQDLWLGITLANNFSIKSSVLLFKGDNSEFTTAEYFDRKSHWPFTVYKTYLTGIPQKLEFDIQRTEQRVNFGFKKNVDGPLELELCELEIYGCEVNHFGSDCQPCIKNDNCVECDVNNGECYVCKEGYTGPNCNTINHNVALQQYTHFQYRDGDVVVNLPSNLVVDGHTTQPSCIDFTPYRNRSPYTLRTFFVKPHNINVARLYLIHEGVADMFLNYTVMWPEQRVLFYHYGLQKVSANSRGVIIPLPDQEYGAIYIDFTFLTDELAEMSHLPVLLCEIELIAGGQTNIESISMTTVDITTESESSTGLFTNTITDSTLEDTTDKETIYTLLSTQTEALELTDITLDLSTMPEKTTGSTRKTTSIASETTTPLDTSKVTTGDDFSTAATKITTVETTSITPESDKISKDAEQYSPSPITNTHLAVGVSVSIFSLLVLFLIVGIVARSCRKPNKQAWLRRENGGQSRNWRILLISSRQDGDILIPRVHLHHYKSEDGAKIYGFNSRLQNY